MKPSKVFEKAAERLYTHGWTKCNYGFDQGPNCMSGAIQRVKGRRAEEDVVGTWYEVASAITEIRFSNVASFNDAPDTTIDDASMALLFLAQMAKDCGE